MKRTPIKRYTPVRKVNRERKARAFQEDFGGKEYVAYIHSLACAVCGIYGYTEAAHLTSRGAGGKACVIAPLCKSRYGILGCHKGYDLRDPEVRSHETRLRGLARDLWTAWQQREGEV